MVKQEPEAYSWADLVRDGKTAWTGVRNYQARNNLKAMKRNDLVLFYHSVSEKSVVGLARVSAEAFPDPTATDGDWYGVEISPVIQLRDPVELATFKSDPVLKNSALVKNSRLSVLPFTREQFDQVLSYSRTRLPK